MNKKLLDEIEWELKEDCSNNVYELDDLESWSETCIDIPSGDLVELFKQVTTNDEWEEIDQMISKIVSDVEKEFDEDDE